MDSKRSDIPATEAGAAANVAAATLTGSKKEEVARPLAKMEKLSFLAVLLSEQMDIHFCPLSPPLSWLKDQLQFGQGRHRRDCIPLNFRRLFLVFSVVQT